MEKVEKLEAVATPEWRKTFWSLRVFCPACKKYVRHGGGDDPNISNVILSARPCNNCGVLLKLVLNKNVGALVD